MEGLLSTGPVPSRFRVFFFFSINSNKETCMAVAITDRDLDMFSFVAITHCNKHIFRVVVMTNAKKETVITATIIDSDKEILRLVAVTQYKKEMFTHLASWLVESMSHDVRAENLFLFF